MKEAVVGIHTIGQTPRPDLLEALPGLLEIGRLEIRGALDGLEAERIPACRPDGYPLETRLRDGTRVVVDAAFLSPRIQSHIDELDDRVDAHLVLCAGPFPTLAGGKPVLQPFDLAATELEKRGHRSLLVVVPFTGQARHAERKWADAGFSCRIRVLDGGPEPRSLEELAGQVASEEPDAVVFDYVGFPRDAMRILSARVGLPAFDLGHLAVEALVLRTRGSKEGSDPVADPEIFE